MYNSQVILDFGDKATEDIFNGENSKAARSIPKMIWAVAQRKLDILNAATVIEDLLIPPSNNLEKLKGNYAGKWSIRVNSQYRVVFSFENGNASEVQIVDYH